MEHGTTSAILASTSLLAGRPPKPSYPLSKQSPREERMKHEAQPWPGTSKLLREWQFARFRHWLHDSVLPFSKHYRELFARQSLSIDELRTPDDLRRIPFTTKKDFAAGPDGRDAVRDF